MSTMSHKFLINTVVGLVCFLPVSSVLAIEGSWQIGVNGGLSLVSPDTDGSAFSLEEDQSTAVSVYFGLDLTPIISTELAFTDLGEAELSDDVSIEYQAISLGATAYLWGSNRAADRAEGLSIYARLGLSSIDNESSIDLDESDNVSVWLGAGIQYPLSNNIGLRAELTSFDGDAQALLAGVYWRTGSGARAGAGNRPVRSPITTGSPTRPIAQEPVAPVSPAPATSTTADPVSADPAPARVAPADSTPPAQNNERPPQAIASQGSQCPADVAAKFVDSNSCSLLNSTVSGVAFNGGTAVLTDQSSIALNNVVRAMQQNPDVGLQISGHVQSLGNEQAEEQLASQRVREVARFLVQGGIPVSRLRAKSFGASQPVDRSYTFQQGSPNNRIEFNSF